MFHNKNKKNKKKKTEIELNNVKNKKTAKDSVIKHASFQLNLNQTSPLEFSLGLFNEIAKFLNFDDLNHLRQVNKTLNRLVEECRTPVEQKFIAPIPKFTMPLSFFRRAGRFGTYAELRQLSKLDAIQLEIMAYQHDLNQREKYERTIPIWPFVLVIGMAAYLALEPYFVYRIYHDDEYHVERNTTRCAEIKHNSTEPALEEFRKHGCHDRSQPFFYASVFFGAVVPILIGFLAFMAFVYRQEKKGPVVQISQSEWKPLLEKIKVLLDKVKEMFPEWKLNDEILEELGNENKLPITVLQDQLDNGYYRLSELKEELRLNLLFKHTPSSPENNEDENKDEVRIDVLDDERRSYPRGSRNGRRE